MSDNYRRAPHCIADGCERPKIARGLCVMHYQRWQQENPNAAPVDWRSNFWSLVDKATECWLWRGNQTGNGYAAYSGPRELGTKSAHRISWMLLRGAIPEGHQLDHLCRVRHCVNPDHLEPVTPRENVLRSASPVAERAAQTECIRGHAFTEENTYISPTSGTRECRECIRVRRRAQRDEINARRRALRAEKRAS